MQRPLYRLPHWCAELAGVLILFWLIWYVASRWGELPERLPTHFNFRGEVDGWGPRKMLLYLPLTAVMVWVLLSVVSFFPSLWNYPVRVTEANAAGLYRCSLNLLLILKLELLILFSCITCFAVNTRNLPVWFTPVALAVIFASVLFPIWRMYRLGKYV